MAECFTAFRLWLLLFFAYLPLPAGACSPHDKRTGQSSVGSGGRRDPLLTSELVIHLRQRNPRYSTSSTGEKRSEESGLRLQCKRCRARKSKCGGTPPLPCGRCVNDGHRCEWEEAEKRLTITVREYNQLRGQVAAAAQRGETISNTTTSPATAHSSVHGPQPGRDSPAEREDYWTRGIDNLLVNQSGEHRFLGPTYALNFARRLNPTWNSLAWDVRPLYDDPNSLRQPTDPRIPPLPSLESVKRLFWVHYSFIGTIFSFIDPAMFEERLDKMYNKPADFASPDSCLVYCQVLLVIAFGLLYSVNQWTGEEGPPGFKFFKYALRLLPDIHEEGSIFFVEVLCYVAYYMQNLNRRDAAFLYVGLGLRMAISLGLHQEVSGEFTDFERDRRRRAWWSVYSLDRLLSVKSGNPITIHDEDISTEWPITAVSSSPSYQWRSIVLINYTQLSRILGRVGEEIYRKKPRSGTSLLASVQRITNDLSCWLRDLPERLRIEFSNLHNQIDRESASIFLHFYSCIIMTVRPLVFNVIQRRLEADAVGSAPDDWKQGLSQTAVSVIESCITAARATIFIMNASAQRNLVATYGYFDGEYAFSAALLLVMVNAAFPYNEANALAMEAAIHLLRGMGDRGNRYIESRHALLLDLRASMNSKHKPPQGPQESASVTLEPPGTSQPIGVPKDPQGDIQEAGSGPMPEWPLPGSMPAARDIDFTFDINDDPGLWDRVLNAIHIDDADMIDWTLRRETA
ncbi:hypothetical protein ASPZODRAFT_149527 [Penicilliopsis zonata CBS 506.65]|uniref:Zn(2)-C6 fungal-type domain-containing protein n=1 Tax=Penicilliopsis zonata CBS 506.65 TaxID=1073090 RepID=A0A1L9SSE0_9EURO|nr:hypothetical protein ASPZODRAFT_149527 [Penicilliopsis zonata CBS 506.65]OJJ50125.1 hypothetical protein ASPZODRAFT_149527 [Penicilliopsis zonata CBS 506.65]